MKEDLFEDENEDRESSESEDREVFADDEALVLSNGRTGQGDDDDDEREEWASLDDDELEEGLSHYTDSDDTEEELDFDSFPENDEKNAEAPPWDEEIERPLLDTENTSKNLLILIGVISFTVALVGIGLFVLLKPEPITYIPEYIVEEEKNVLFVTKKVPGIRIKDTAPAEKTEKKAEPAQPVVKENAGPVISGKPLTIAHEGVFYSFVPKADDADSPDRLKFFIANQPDWTSFNTTTGALTGTPQKDDVGTHEKIDILVSDGKAMASFPLFDITVIGAGSPEAQEKDLEARPKGVNADLYTLPDLKDLIELSEFNDAAIEYHKNVRHVPKAYTLKLEVDCVEGSVQEAFRNGNFDNRMFILPKDIQGKACFIVFWGLYATKDEALKALASIPAYFRDREIKPKLTIIKQYL